MKRAKKKSLLAVVLSCLLVLNMIVPQRVLAANPPTNDDVNPPQTTTGKTDITSWNFGSLPVATNGDIAATSGYYNNATTLLQLFQGATPTKTTSGFTYSTSSLKNTGFEKPSYWSFTTSTKGFKDLVFNFTMYSAKSGPRDFDTEWSTDGINWSVFGILNTSRQYTVKNPNAQLQNYGMKLPVAAENKDVIYIRVIKKSDMRTDGTATPAGSTNIGNNINGIQMFGTKDPLYTTPTVATTTDTSKAILDVTPITLSCSDDKAQIYYTTDGTTPATTVGGSTKLYTAPFTALSEGGFKGANPFVVKAVAKSGTLLTCDEVTLSYNQQTITSNADAKKLTAGTYAWVKGIGTYLTANRTLYIQDGMNVGSGLCIDKSGANFSSFVGKEIYVYGKATNNNGLMQIVPDAVDTINVVVRNASPTIPTPTKIMFDQLSDRAYEGMLVAFDTVKLDTVTGTDVTKTVNHTVSQAGVQCTLRANGIATSVGTTGSYVNITKAIASYYSGVQLLSSKTSDLVATTTPTVEFMTAKVTNGTAVPLNSKVTLATKTANATIKYTLNDGAPVTSTSNSVDVTIDSFKDGKAVITASATDGSYTTATQTFTYTQSQVANVSANPGFGAVAATTPITLSSTTTAAKIVYSLYKNSFSDADGTLVGTADQAYTAPITLDASYFPVRIVAKATLDNYLDSNVSTFTYTLKKAAGGEKNYYGAIHGHTAENSDGQGTLAEADAWARDQGKFDYFILTDHSNSFDKAPAGDTVASIGNINNYNKDNQQWLNGKAEAAKATTPTFLCDYGYEMTWSGGPGHMNTFNTTGFVSRNNTILNNKTNNDAGMRAYYELLKNTPGSISQFNHPGSTFGNFANFAYYDPQIDDKVNLVEVGNGEGEVGSGGYFQSIDQYILALDKGWHLAPTNNGDNHKKAWGTSNTCATVVYTNDYTMSGIYQAMRDRSVWATENRDLDVTYHLSDGTDTYSMGAILDKAPATANITVTAKNKNTSKETSNIASVQLISGGGKVVDKKEYSAGNSDVTYTYSMTAPTPGYYFAKITDNQGFVAVTAPIWLGSAPKVGITSVVNNTVMPVTTEAMKLTTTFFNNESSAVNLKSVSYTVDGDATANKKYDLGTSIASLGSATHEFTYTPTTAGDKTVNISAVITVNGVDTTYTATSTMKVVDINKVLYVGLDASHGNEYVSGGSYPDSMGNMMNLAAKNDIRVVQLKTSQDLINACSNSKYKMMILNAPSRKNVAAWPNPTNYTPDETAALKAFSENGNTIVFGNIADYAESKNADSASPKKHMSGLQNEVLSAIGSTLREGDDEIMDDDKNGGQAFRLYPTELNMDNPLLQGVVSGQTYSQYSGSTIYAVDPVTGERTSTLPTSVSPLVYGFPTTYSAECDDDNFGYDTDKDPFPFVTVGTNKADKGMSNSQGLYIPKYVNPNSNVASNPEEKLMAASEYVVHPNGKKSLVVVAGGSFMSNFEIQVTQENAATLPYVNYNLMDNLYKVASPLTITSAADAKSLPDGTEVIIEATATSEINTQSTNTDTNKGFFDCIYAQDATGGINLFPVASGIKEGQKARFFGKIAHYQGEVELTVSKFTILSESIKKFAPTSLTSKDSMLPSNTGLLVKTQGMVSNVIAETDKVTGVTTVNQFTINDGTGPATVFINGYITKGTSLPFIKDGAFVSVTGLASIGEVQGDSNMHPRIRVRDRAEIVSIDKFVTDITITSQPTKTEYVVGQSIDLKGLVVNGTYNDGTKAPVTITSSNISGFDNTTTGSKTVTVTVDGRTATFNVNVIPKVLTGMEITKQPTKTEYVVGQSLDLKGLVVTGTYNDGAKAPVTITSSNISGFDSTTTGTKTVTVTVEGKTATFDINVIAKALTGIEITSEPTKTEYVVGQSLDLTGLVVKGIYNDGTKSPVTITSLNIIGFDSLTTGTKTVTAAFEGKTATFNVNVVAKALTGIEITKQPTKTEYVVKQSLDLTGVEVIGTYNDGTKAPITITSSNVSGFDSLATMSVGRKTITINVEGKTATFDIDVIAKALTGIEVTKQPTKTEYVVGQSLDLTGIEVIGTYNDGTKESLLPVEISGFDSTTAGSKTVTVTVDGKTATFNVNVKAKALTGIEVTSQPTKTEYVVGQSLDLTGLVVTGTYNDGTKSPITITSSNISGFDSTTAGTKTVTVTVGGKTATFNVNVKAVAAPTEEQTLESNDKAKVLELIGNNTTKVITVVANTNKVVDKAVFEGMKGKDKTLTVKTQVENNPSVTEIEFTFNGLNMKPEDVKSMDLSLRAVPEHKNEILALDKNALILSFNDSGNLPGITNVRIKLSKTYTSSDKLYLYYFNPTTNKPEIIAGPVSPDKDGYITVGIKHFSDYFITETAQSVSAANTTNTTSANLPKTGSPIDMNVLLGLGILLIASGAFVIFRKKRTVKKA